MKILVLSFYYRPDLSACSFRTQALVGALRDVVPDGSQIDLLTTAPNRYHSFAADAPEREDDGTVSVSRIPLPPHRSGLMDQSRAFLAYARAVMRQVRGRRYDVVFATSSRLMTAVLGAAVARRVRAKLYLDIRDIFVDTMQDVLPGHASWAVGPVFGALERWAVGGAARVNLVSAGFADYFRRRYPAQRFSYFTNGVDDEFAAAAPRSRGSARSAADFPITVLYAGNLGEGQGLHAIVPGIARAMGERIRFRIIGDGGRRDELVTALAKAGVTNVEVEAPLRREALLQAYREADVLFVHLNDHAAFKKVLPSKIFEYAALGKPVWAGVAGYAAAFLTTEVDNAAVFPPCDVEAAVRAFSTLTLAETPRPGFLARYGRTAISRAMAAEIVAVGAEA